MSQREAIKVIGDVLASELGLRSSGPDSQIMLTNERFDIPVNNDIYIALGYIDGKAIGNNNYAVPTDAGMNEIQQVTMLYHIQIDMMSFGPDARTRKEEIFQALRSLAAQTAMETWNMQIARMPGVFVDASSLEATKMLNRYTITIAVTALLTKTKAVQEYYDQFPTPEVIANE